MPPKSASATPSAAAATFGSIHGHDLAKRYLASAAAAGTMPHALLLHGPRGVGKLCMAHALAKLVNAPAGTDPVWAAEIDRKIAEGVFADILVVEPRGLTGQITLAGWKSDNDPDELQYYRFLDTRPLEGLKKVVIIRQVDRMNIPLANYLLKLMEEPPSYLMLVLLTHRRGDVLPTIRSRCAPVKLSPLTAAEMEGFAAAALPAGARGEAGALIRQAGGSPGALLGMTGAGAGRRRTETAWLMRMFQQYGFVGLFKVASELLKAGGDGGARGAAGQDQFDACLSALLAWLRDALVLKSAGAGTDVGRLLVNPDLRTELEAYAAGASERGLALAAERVRAAFVFGPRQTDKGFVLETLLMRMGQDLRPI